MAFWTKKLIPFASFGAGWCGYHWLDSRGLISAEVQQMLVLFRLRTQRTIQSFLPNSVIETYGTDPKHLDFLIELNEGPPDGQDHVATSFTDILKECGPAEQVSFLEDHFLEDIPFFFISDIVFSWTRLHRGVYFPTMEMTYDGKSAKCFESKVLCTKMWSSIVKGIIPFDVGVSAMAILSCSSVKNSRTLSCVVSPNDLMKQYQEFTTQLHSHSSASALISLEEINAATVSLLYSLERGSRRGLSGWWSRVRGRTPSHEHTTRNLDQGLWCGAVRSLIQHEQRNNDCESCGFDTRLMTFVEGLCAHYRCPL